MNTLTTFFDWLLTASLRASVLTLVVLGVQFVFRKHLGARARYALWLPVLVVLLTPVLPQSRWSIENLFVKAPQTVLMPPMAPATPVEVSLPSVEIDTPAPKAVDWPQIGLFAWMSIAAAFLLFGAFSFFRTLRRFQRTKGSLSDETTALIQQIAREVGLRHAPRVWCSSAITSPAVTGFFRPVLLLPADFDQAFTAPEARLILQHELTHVKRHDLPLNALLCTLMALHWFNPLLWLAFYKARLDREAACDAQVLENAPPQRRMEYGHALLKAETAFAPLKLSLGFVGLFQSGAALRSRIQSIAHHQPSHPAMKLVTLASIGLLTFLGITRAEEPSNVIGKTEFRPGDSIRITNVQRGDNFLTVTAEYELASEPQATISLFITRTKGDGKSKPAPSQFQSITKGKGTVTLHHPAVGEGMPHISYYPAKGGSAFGGIYFGTQAEADLSRGMNLNYRQKSAANGGTDAASAVRDRLYQVEAREYVFEKEKIGSAFSRLAGDAGIQLIQLPDDHAKMKHGTINYQKKDNPFHLLETLTKIVGMSLDYDKGLWRLRDIALEAKLQSLRIPHVQFRGATLEEAVEFLRAKSREIDTEANPSLRGVNIFLKGAAKETKVSISLDLRDISIGEVLRYVTDLSQTKLQIGAASVVISPISDAATKPADKAAAAKNTIVLPQVELREVALDEALEFIRAKSSDVDPDKKGVNILRKPGGADVTLSLSLKQVPVNEALRYIAELAKHQLTSEGNTFILTPVK